MTIIYNLSWLPEECEWFYREVVNHREAYSRATGCVNAVKTRTHSILRRTLKIIILIPITNIIITTIIIISFFFWSSFVKQRDRRTEALLILGSKEAEWDKDLNSYVLNYHGRASQVCDVWMWWRWCFLLWFIVTAGRFGYYLEHDHNGDGGAN